MSLKTITTSVIRSRKPCYLWRLNKIVNMSTTQKSKQNKKIDDRGEIRSENEAETMYSRIINSSYRLPSFGKEELLSNFELGRKYNINTSKKHNQLHQEYAWKIALRKEALAALPQDLKCHAKIVDESGPPLTRRMATWTPPIPNFDADYYRRKIFMQKKEE